MNPLEQLLARREENIVPLTDEWAQKFVDVGVRAPKIRDLQVLVLPSRIKLTAYVREVWDVGDQRVAYISSAEDHYSNTYKYRPIEQNRLISDLATIPGLLGITVVPYMLAITKSEAFEWGELYPLILECLKTQQIAVEFQREQDKKS